MYVRVLTRTRRGRERGEDTKKQKGRERVRNGEREGERETDLNLIQRSGAQVFLRWLGRKAMFFCCFGL